MAAPLWLSSRASRAAKLVFGAVALDAAMSFENVWPTPAIEWNGALSLEVALLLLALASWTGWRARGARGVAGAGAGGGAALGADAGTATHTATRIPPAALRIAGVVGIALVLGHYADVTVPALYGRPVNLHWDARHLPNLLAMAVAGIPLHWLLAGVAGVVASLWLLGWLLYRCCAMVADGLVDRALRRLTIVVTLAVLLVGGAVRTPLTTAWPALDELWAWYAAPVSQAWYRQLRFLVEAASPQRASATIPPSPTLASDLAALEGADVLLVFVESYGATAFDMPAHAQVVGPEQARLAQAARDSGRMLRSAYVRSPTFGGGSWFAHSSLLSGVEVGDGERYERLLASDRPTLVGVFRARGWRTVALMPGLQTAWPEGDFYGYDVRYDRAALDYRGPAFGHWAIPDQFTIDALVRRELGPGARPPRFVVYPTINSHAPFVPVPPYQPDWSRLAGERPFDEPPLAASLAQLPDWWDLSPGWSASIAYTMRWLAGFVAQRAPRDLVLVVVGDHQPAAGVAGPDASWDVPVHVIARQPRIVAALEAAGFTDGVAPQRPAIAAMSALGPLLLEAFDGAAR